MNKLFTFIIACVLLSSCNAGLDPEKQCYNDSDPPRNFQKVSIDQGLWGDVWFWSGNFMPIGRGQICQARREVHIYELTTSRDVKQIEYTPFYTEIKTKHIVTVTSGHDGFFEVNLPAGTYSIFIKEGDKYYSNSSTTSGISPITIQQDKVEEVRIDITYQAVF